VTGGLGFIGSHLVRMLHERGERVRILDVAEPSAEASPPPGVEVREGDIVRRDAVRAAMEDVDVVYHVAARAGLWAPDPGEFERVNRGGSRIVFEEAARAGAERAVLCSSEVTLKGRTDGPSSAGPIDETVEPAMDDLLGPYARGKRASEEEARSATAAGFPVVIVNPTVPIGPGDHNLTPPARMLLGYLNGRYPAYLEAVYDMVDVRDVARGHILAAERGRPGERYLLGSETIRMSAFLRQLEEITGLRTPRLRIPYALALGAAHVSEFVANHVTGGPPAAPVIGVRLLRDENVFSHEKAERELGITFGPVREALRDAVRWFMQQGHVTRPLPRLH